MKTKQIVFTKPNVAELLEVDYAKPKENEVTVELEYSAISQGTEKANILGKRNNICASEGEKPNFPRASGYSATGTVTDIGSCVDNLKVGDKVVVFWGLHKKNITIDQHNVFKIPDGVGTDEASMSHIATFPLAAIRKTKLEIGESAMVMGLGILGIFAVQELKAAGAYPIIAVDPVKNRREFALKMGADFAIDPTMEGYDEEIKNLTDGGVNVCIEVTGLGIGLIQALNCMRRFGRVALLGCTRNSKFEIDYYGKVHGPGISLIGAHTLARPNLESSAGYWTDRDDLKTILNLIKGKRMNFKDMICEIHSPNEAGQVYDRLINEKEFPIGVIFDWRQI